MFGATAKNKPYYRCSATRADYARPSVDGHPPTYAVREERILAALDAWLAVLTDSDHLDATVASIVNADRQNGKEPVEIKQARRRQKRLDTELERMIAAIRAGMDPILEATETRKIQDELAATKAAIHDWERSSRATHGCLTETDIRAALTDAGGLIGLLDQADRADRAALYQALGMSLRYEKDAATGVERVHTRLLLKRSGGSVLRQDIGNPSLAS